MNPKLVMHKLLGNHRWMIKAYDFTNIDKAEGSWSETCEICGEQRVRSGSLLRHGGETISYTSIANVAKGGSLTLGNLEKAVKTLKKGGL